MKANFRLVSLTILGALCIYLIFRKREAPYQHIQGTTMGTISYNVKYQNIDGKYALDSEIDSILVHFNQILSTYISDSEISQFNRSSTDTFLISSDLFIRVLEESKEVYEKTNGYFDPTVGPLVNEWGFGPKKDHQIDSAKVEQLLNLVGMNKISFDNQFIVKLNPASQLDFSAIAKGYAVDIVADYLSSLKIDNFMVEIGGEVRCSGLSPRKAPWKIGINDPLVAKEAASKLFAVAALTNQAVATSGNYRNYYFKNGRKYAHTIDPHTGFPSEHKLLSASVFASECMKADAYATGFMSMGLEKSLEILKKESTISAMLIYQDSSNNMATWVSDRLKNQLDLKGHE